MVTSIKGKKLNKGEWAEFYVMLKLLGEGRLYTGNKLLQKNYQNYLDILKIIRQEYDTNVLEYVIDKNRSAIDIKIQNSDDILVSIPADEFKENAKTLFDGIKNLKGRSVAAPDSVCDFAKIIYVSKPKAPAVKALKRQFGGKNDIFIEVRDGETSIVSVMGFSIKSKFGQNPTLFNAGTSSQFLYKITGCDDVKMKEFNAIGNKESREWTLCREYLLSNNISLEYARTLNPAYDINLMLVRESMSKVLAWCAKDRLVDSPNKNHGVMETVERMIEENPLNVTNPRIYYEKAVKDFLMSAFTGMTAAKQWDGREQVNGGYIVVMDDGDVICYHSNDREYFRDYLYRNTHFEYVGAGKFKWSRIDKYDDEYYLALNFSVRFNTHTR